MTDVILLAVVVAFFALSAGYVALCDRIGRDDSEVKR
jgi:hypothetical protein